MGISFGHLYLSKWSNGLLFKSPNEEIQKCLSLYVWKWEGWQKESEQKHDRDPQMFSIWLEEQIELIKGKQAHLDMHWGTNNQ